MRARSQDEGTARHGRRGHETVGQLVRGRGCSYCGDSGYSGRRAVHEGLAVSSDIKRLVLQGATEDEIHAQALREGFVTLHVDGQHKVIDGVTTLDEVDRVVLSD